MPPKNNSHFCCCSGDMCNLNFTDGYDPTAHTTTTPFIPTGRPMQDHSYKIKTVIISLVSVFSVALVIIVAYLGYRMCTRPKHQSIESLHTPESPPIQPEFDMDDLKLCSIISKGRYAEVWRGKLADVDVAVKMYSPHYRDYYNNERTLYRLPFMDHDGLVRFYGADERITQEGSAQLMIVMLYIPLGALNGYLKNNTLDWPTMVRMAHSVAKALSHLHTDIQKGDQFKPVLAHRDLNTRNILVRADLTCVVSDLGFAVATMGSKLIKKGHAEVAEQTSLTDVGTLRYMAPELLDGAVNLRDCEASLKQIDIYALGLVLWEIAMRCVDLYQGAPVPEYTPPFQTEIGSSPTFEEMQLMVVRAKKRPKFPEVWKETNQAVRSLKETIEECWDADAEARLTALCVEERLSDLPNLWAHEIKHRGMTPTLNAMINITETHTTTTTMEHGVNINANTTSAANTGSTPSFSSSSSSSHPQTATTATNSDVWVAPDSAVTSTAPNIGVRDSDVTAAAITGASLIAESQLPNGYVIGAEEVPCSPSLSLTQSWLQDPSVSTGTTDTILPITPSSESTGGPPTTTSTAILPPKASNLLQERNSTVLRPHTGRNPTVERNTHKRSDEELRVSGNTLVSSLGYSEQRPDSLSTQGALTAEQSLSAADSPPADYLSDGLETSLVQNDALSHRNPPIPYVQNQVHGNVPQGRPKVANTPCSRGYPREHTSLRDKLSRFIRPKQIGLRLSSLNIFGGGRRHDYSRADDLEVDDLHPETAGFSFHAPLPTPPPPPPSHHVPPSQHASNLNQDVATSQQNGVSPPQPIHTEVSLLNGTAVTRPANLILSSSTSVREASTSASSSLRHCSNREASAMIREMVREDLNQKPHADRETSLNREISVNAKEPSLRSASTAEVNREGTSPRPYSNHGISTGVKEMSSSPRSPSSAAARIRVADSNLRSSVGESVGSSRSSCRSGREASVDSCSSTMAADGQNEDDVFMKNDATSLSHQTEEVKRYPENRLRFAEVGVAKLQLPTVSQQPVRRVEGQSKSTSELLHLRRGRSSDSSSDSCWQETELTSHGRGSLQRQRPNSLSLMGHNYSPKQNLLVRKSASKPDITSVGAVTIPPNLTKKHALENGTAAESLASKEREAIQRSGRASSVEEVHRGSRSQHAIVVEDPSEKIRRRVKTPVRPSKKSCRLSLYDDRLMSSEAFCNLRNEDDDVVGDNDIMTKSLTGSFRLSQGFVRKDSDASKLGAGKIRKLRERGSNACMSIRDCHPSSHHAQGASAMSISNSDIVV